MLKYIFQFMYFLIGVMLKALSNFWVWFKDLNRFPTSSIAEDLSMIISKIGNGTLASPVVYPMKCSLLLYFFFMHIIMLFFFKVMPKYLFLSHEVILINDPTIVLWFLILLMMSFCCIYFHNKKLNKYFKMFMKALLWVFLIVAVITVVAEDYPKSLIMVFIQKYFFMPKIVYFKNDMFLYSLMLGFLAMNDVIGSSLIFNHMLALYYTFVIHNLNFSLNLFSTENQALLCSEMPLFLGLSLMNMYYNIFWKEKTNIESFKFLSKSPAPYQFCWDLSWYHHVHWEFNIMVWTFYYIFLFASLVMWSYKLVFIWT